MRSRKICSIEGCEKTVNSRGWCSMHYWRWRTHGDTSVCTTNRYIAMEDRFWMKVEKGPSCWNWTGTRNRDGYGNFTTGDKKTWKAHRLAYTLLVAPIPDGKVIDHRCHNTSCVNPAHLRVVTKKQNGEHRLGARRDNKATGLLGVSRPAGCNRYYIKVTHHGEHYGAGSSFATLEEAAEAVKQLRLSLYTHNDVDRRAS